MYKIVRLTIVRLTISYVHMCVKCVKHIFKVKKKKKKKIAFLIPSYLES